MFNKFIENITNIKSKKETIAIKESSSNKEDNAKEDIIKPMVFDTRSNYSDKPLENYNKAVNKDKEVYINMFGSEKEKEQLKADKITESLKLEEERLYNQKLIEADLALEKIQNELAIQKEKDNQINKVKTIIEKTPHKVEFFDVKLVKLLNVPKSYWEIVYGLEFYTELLEDIQIIEGNITWLKNSKNELLTKIYSESLESLKTMDVTAITKTWVKRQIETDNLLFKYQYKVRSLDDMHYDFKTTALIDLNLNAILDYMFEQLNSLDDKTHTIEIDTKYVGYDRLYSGYTITIENKQNNFSINIDYRYINIKNNCIKENNQVTFYKETNNFENKRHTFDLFFVQVLSKTWNDTKIEDKLVEGLKTRFNSHISEHNIKINLDKLVF